MRKIDELVDDELIEEAEEKGQDGLSDDEVAALFDDDDPAPADRRRDPLRRQAGFIPSE